MPVKGGKTFDADRHTRLLLLLWVVWLPFLAQPIEEMFRHSSSVRIIFSLAGTIIFILIYLWTVWTGLLVEPHHNSQGTWSILSCMSLGALVVLSITLTLSGGSSWIVMFILTSACVGLHFPNTRGVAIVGGLLLLTGFSVWRTKTGWANAGKIMLMAGFVGINVLNVVRTLKTNRELREAREEIARLAVNEERLRFARDLHDLLGHNVSLIALKSELAEYLAPSALEKSIEAMREVGTIARTALQEVRGAVAGYRQPTLSTELVGTAEILAAAGIAYEFTGSPTVALPRDVESVLAWAVREGITNVVRHSRAKHCSIHFDSQDDKVRIEIADDGQGNQVDSLSNVSGNGLTGLSERLKTVNGTVEFGPRPKGGYHVRVAIPLTEHSNRLTNQGSRQK